MDALAAGLTLYPWVWAALFFATLGALLICIARLRQKNTMDAARQEESNAASEKNIILSFLIDQFDKTKRLTENLYFRHDEIDKHACSLRSAYLKIEEKSLKNYSDQRSYHLAINKALVKLLTIIRNDVKRAENEVISDKSLHEAVEGSTLSPAEKHELKAKIEEFCIQLKSGAISAEQRKKRYKSK
jgi:hypothetical protein